MLRSTAPRSSKWSAPSGNSFAGESSLVGGIVNRPRNVFTDAFGSSDVNTAEYDKSGVSGSLTTWSAPSATPPPRTDCLELSHAVTAHDLEDDRRSDTLVIWSACRDLVDPTTTTTA